MRSIFQTLSIPILLLYVFFRDFRPSEPFLTLYLNETKNFSKQQINNEIYPIWSYSQLPIFIFVLAVTDVVNFRPMIWFGASGYVATWLLLVFGNTVKQMQLMQVTYAIGTACEVAYKSYVFVAVSKSDYSKVSLFVAGSALLGRSMSSFTSQLLYEYGHVSFLELNYISLGSVSLAFILSLFIQPPRYLEPKITPTIQPSTDEHPLILDGDISTLHRVKEILTSTKNKIVLSYKNVQTRRWAYWAICTSAIYFMVSF